MELPKPFIMRITEQLPQSHTQFIQALTSPSPTSIRFHPLKGADASLSDLPLSSPIPWHPQGIYLSERPSFTADPWFHAGVYYVQEPSSMLIYQMLKVENYTKVLDLCAAPGGKSTLLAAAILPDTVLISNEIIRNRAAILSENLTRWGYPMGIVTQNDPYDFRTLTHYFDCILVDAPCSGEGMFRKDKESIKEWSPENVEKCSVRQQNILSNILPTLAPNGHLLYATCTYSTLENEHIIEWVLEKFPDMEIDTPLLDEAWGAESVMIHGMPHAAYRCYPHQIHGEGFFVCRLRKKGEKKEASNEAPPFFSSKKDSHKPKFQGKKSQAFPLETLEKWITPFHASDISIFDENIFHLPAAIQATIATLPRLNILKKGTLLGKIQGGDFTPSHDLAMSTLLRTDLPRLPLTYSSALQFLQKMDLEDTENIPKGWYIATYKNAPLGWLKAAAGRLKNHYPIHWRIRNI